LGLTGKKAKFGEMTMAGSFKMRKEREQRDELLSAYLDGQLGARERVGLEARLAADPALRSELEVLRHTVALVHSLPSVPVPRNFILPQAAATRPQPARSVRPRQVWAAPLLTAATAVVSLACVAVLAGDLLLSNMGGVAFAPGAPAAAPLEAPQVALEATSFAAEVEVTVVVEVEKAVVETGAPVPTEAPLAAAPAATIGAQEYVTRTAEGMLPTASPASEAEREVPPAPAPTPSPPPPGEVAAQAPTAGPALAMEATPVPAMPMEATPAPTAAAAATAAQEAEMRDVGPTPGEVAQVPPVGGGEEALRATEGVRGAPEHEVAGRAVLSLPRILEVVLGLAAVGLALATVWAWRARRR